MSTTHGAWWTNASNLGPWFSVGEDRVRLLRDGAEAFPAMHAAICEAKREILLEMYWVGSDVVGTTFRDALVERAHAGVTVRVIYDAVGSLSLTPSFWEPLVNAGGDVRAYHPLSPFAPAFDLSGIEERDHRKLLVVDGTHGFVGGLNLARAWLPIEAGGDGWRDDVIELSGRAPAELRTLFFKTWRRMGRGRLHLGLFASGSTPHDVAPLSKHPRGKVYVLASLRRNRRSLRRETLARLAQAAHSIDIANSYFLPDRRVRSALRRAVARGVRVRVLVPMNSDVKLVQYALESMFETLLESGIEVYRFRGPMMHAKTTIVDDRFTSIGSFNLDERSRSKNLELNVAVEDEAFAKHVRSSFERDLAAASRLSLFEWSARPLRYRVIETFAHALRKLW